MNCTHCLELIDAHPLAELAAGQLDRIQRHARACPRCRQALAKTRSMELKLASLHDPEPPEGLEASIMQQVFQRAAERPLVSTPPRTRRMQRDRRPLATLALGGIMALGAEAQALLSGGMTLAPAHGPFGAGMHALASMPHGNASLAILAVGLLLMLSGLSAATETRQQAEGRS